MIVGLFANRAATVHDAVAAAEQAREDGFGAVWYPQVDGLDAMTAIAVVARGGP